MSFEFVGVWTCACVCERESVCRNKHKHGKQKVHRILCFILQHFARGLIIFSDLFNYKFEGGGNVGNHESTEKYNFLCVFPQFFYFLLSFAFAEKFPPPSFFFFLLFQLFSKKAQQETSLNDKKKKKERKKQAKHIWGL